MVRSHRQKPKLTVPSSDKKTEPVATTGDLCIDTSYWQGKISVDNWKKVAKKCGYVIHRASYTGQSSFTLNTDSTFLNNFKNAQAAGLKCGAYHYSQATTVEEAKKEAEFLCKQLAGLKVDFYVVCDYEFGGRLNSKTASKASDVANAFCDVVKSHGYSPIIYVNYSTITNYLKNPKYPIWIAQYSSKCSYTGKKVMWQYTSSGNVDGISGNVDLSHVYTIPEPEPESTSYTGTLPSMRVKKTAKEVIADALAWGKWIAGNDIYHYGEYGNKAYITPSSKYYEGGKYKKIYNVTHSSGCHFCGTEERRKKKDARALGFNAENWEHTYVCNTFVTAMFAHGGMDPTCHKYCSQGSCVGMNVKGRSSKLDKSKYWQYMGKLAIKDLQPGDVLVSASHMQCVYAKASSTKLEIIEATSYIGKYGNEASKKSIRIIEKKPSYTSVYRYTGSINQDISLRHGEYSDRVKLWQEFLNWAGYNCGSVDGKFGDNTLIQTKEFQKKAGLTADGIIGPKTLEKAKNTEKTRL